jgi:hypothetical protein
LGVVTIACGAILFIGGQFGPTSFPSPPENVDLDAYRSSLEAVTNRMRFFALLKTVGNVAFLAGAVFWIVGAIKGRRA